MDHGMNIGILSDCKLSPESADFQGSLRPSISAWCATSKRPRIQDKLHENPKDPCISWEGRDYIYNPKIWEWDHRSYSGGRGLDS